LTQDHEIAEMLKKMLVEKNQQGSNVMSGKTQDYDSLVLLELNKIENSSNTYKEELRALSKGIRKYFWNGNSKILYQYLHKLNGRMGILSEYIPTNVLWNLNTILDYLLYLANRREALGTLVTQENIDSVIDSIVIANAQTLIEKQWEDVLQSSDGMKTFMEVFDDIFENAVKMYPELFIRELDGSEYIYRMVKEKTVMRVDSSHGILLRIKIDGIHQVSRFYTSHIQRKIKRIMRISGVENMCAC